jgi:hypothetical protein
MLKMGDFAILPGKKQSQFTGLWPETRNSKSEIRNLWIQKKKLKTNPICQPMAGNSKF